MGTHLRMPHEFDKNKTTIMIKDPHVLRRRNFETVRRKGEDYGRIYPTVGHSFHKVVVIFRQLRLDSSRNLLTPTFGNRLV